MIVHFKVIKEGHVLDCNVEPSRELRLPTLDCKQLQPIFNVIFVEIVLHFAPVTSSKLKLSLWTLGLNTDIDILFYLAGNAQAKFHAE